VTADVAIVGGGLAGVSAALWARSLELEPVLIDPGPRIGGQLERVHFELPNLAGMVAGNGTEVAARLADQLAARRITLRLGVRAVSLDAAVPAIGIDDGSTLEARAVLIATGVRRRRLDVPGESDLEGRGVSFSATGDHAQLAGRDVIVVGGGDAAFENALILRDLGCRVTLAVRGTPRARSEFQRRIGAAGIEVLTDARVLAIFGGTQVTGVRLETPAGVVERDTGAVVIKAGVVPNTEWCRTAVPVDAEGYVVVDAALRTTRPRVWAAGDVTRPPRMAAAIALGHGAVAIESIRRILAAGAAQD
jgi:thioredoxin reductase (NADPH)